jgi:hypothetical protein
MSFSGVFAEIGSAKIPYYLSSRSDFGFKFAEIFVIGKRLSNSALECLKENLASRRVGDSPTQRVGESPW